jgi:hypothetical protein
VTVNGVCAISAVHIGRRYGLKRSKSSVASSNDEAILWTCVEVVQHYINRVQAYNGVSRCTTRCSLSLSLTGDCTRYVSTSSYTPTKIPEPGLPFSLVFRADPGSEDVLSGDRVCLRSSFQAPRPSPAFGPLPTNIKSINVIPATRQKGILTPSAITRPRMLRRQGPRASGPGGQTTR